VGFLSGLKRLKLKKLKPGKILVAIGKKIGGPVGGVASALEKGAAAFNKVKQQAKDLGLTPAQTAEVVATDAANALDAYATAGGPAAGSNTTNTLLLVGIAAVVLLLVMRK